MGTLHLIRHAEPEVARLTPSSEWVLAPDSSVDGLRDSGVLPKAARWFTSPETKAQQTAALFVPNAVVVDGLREVERPDTWFDSDGDFQQAVTDYLTDGVIPEGLHWEPRVDATLRVVDNALGIMATYPESDWVLVGHGTVLTLLVASLTGSKPDVDAWRALQMPDHCALRQERNGGFEITSPWGAWAR